MSNMEMEVELAFRVRIESGDCYSGSGYEVSTSDHGNIVHVGEYSHCSCYGTDEAETSWLFEGRPGQFMDKFVIPNADLAMPSRSRDPEDHDYESVTALYDTFRRWYEGQKGDRKVPVMPPHTIVNFTMSHMVPKDIIDVDVYDRSILRLPRMYSHVHDDVQADRLDLTQLQKLGTLVSKKVLPKGKTTILVADKRVVVNMYTPDQYHDLCDCMESIRL